MSRSCLTSLDFKFLFLSSLSATEQLWQYVTHRHHFIYSKCRISFHNGGLPALRPGPRRQQVCQKRRPVCGWWRQRTPLTGNGCVSHLTLLWAVSHSFFADCSCYATKVFKKCTSCQWARFLLHDKLLQLPCDEKNSVRCHCDACTWRDKITKAEMNAFVDCYTVKRIATKSARLGSNYITHQNIMLLATPGARRQTKEEHVTKKKALTSPLLLPWQDTIYLNCHLS